MGFNFSTSNKIMFKPKLSHAIIGLAIGDALGVPVEFMSRDYLKVNPVLGMLEYGTHMQPKGTWSDDTSLTLALIDALLKDYSLERIANEFVLWFRQGKNTAHGVVFDIGNQTRTAILELEAILNRNEPKDLKLLKYSTDEYSNGNGSLMRILPLFGYIKKFDITKRFEIIRDVSALTHGHIRSAIACFIYLEFIYKLLNGSPKNQAYQKTKLKINRFLVEQEINRSEVELFNTVLQNDISVLNESEIKSSGYVIDTLEASLWCFLTTNSYKECVLKVH